MNRRNFFGKLLTATGVVALARFMPKDKSPVVGLFQRAKRYYRMGDNGEVESYGIKQYYACVPIEETDSYGITIYRGYASVVLQPIHLFDAYNLISQKLNKLDLRWDRQMHPERQIPENVFKYQGTWFYITTDVPARTRSIA